MTDIKEMLRQVSLFAHLPDPQLQWLTEQGTEVWLEPGEQIAAQGNPADGFYVILQGETSWTKEVQGETVHAVTLGAGEVFAELILLLDEPYPTTGRAVTKVQLYKLTPDCFWEMLRMCPSIFRSILKISAQRSQIHESVTQQQAKLISLGTLSAGLAHELNNPAAAVKRNVFYLEEVLQKLPNLALKIHEQPMMADQVKFLSDLYLQATESAKQGCKFDPIAQSEAEDAIADWLEDHDVENGWKLSPMLVMADLHPERLDEIMTHLDPKCLGSVLTWLEATLTGIKLLEDIKLGATRMSELVMAMKSYSYMDKAQLQELDVHEGIDNTLTILKHKLKYGMTVKREYGDLPKICAYGPLLNQVWTNLIDNAVDATQGKGHLWIRTVLEGDRILVEIADDGAGIPTEIQPRIFEQFFTTKEVGQGTGLGLDIVRRVVVGQHKGDVHFESKPGDTRFQVRLPLRPPKTTASSNE